MSNLNDKLAKRAGFRWRYDDITRIGWYCNGEFYGSKLPDFPNDPNACLERLMPKLLEEYNIESYWFLQHDDWYYSETNIWRKGSTKHGYEILHDQHIAKRFEQGTDLGKITALALCKAIEQVVDAECNT